MDNPDELPTRAYRLLAIKKSLGLLKTKTGSISAIEHRHDTRPGWKQPKGHRSST
jgi:hypothetical protein